MICPSCLNQLVLSKSKPPVLQCRKCRGQWLSFEKFNEKVVDQKTYQELLLKAHTAEAIGKLCPSCRNTMKPLVTAENKSPLDICFKCSHIWFDFLEFETFRTKGDALGNAFVKIRESQKTEVAGVSIEGHALSGWDAVFVPDSFGSAVQSDRMIKGFPAITYISMAAILLTFIKFRKDIPTFWMKYAFSSEIDWHGWWRLFTSFFVHSDWGHLFGNLYFMMLIAPKAEDASTTQDFLVVLLGGHALGTIMQSWVTPGTYIGGASAGIFSVLAYYSILFPKARFSAGSFLPRLRYSVGGTYIRYSMPIQVFVVAKLGIEFLNLIVAQRGVAHMAHIGGAIIGVAMGLTRKNQV